MLAKGLRPGVKNLVGMFRGEFLPQCALGVGTGVVLQTFSCRAIQKEWQLFRAHQVPSTTPLPVDHLLEKLFKYVTLCTRGARAVRIFVIEFFLGTPL